MSTFKVRAMLIHPEHRERRVDAEMLVDTGSSYILLPPELVAHLGLALPYERRAMLASGERVTYRIGEVRISLGDEERTTVFMAGPPGSQPLLGAVTLEEFALAIDPLGERLVSREVLL